MVKDTNEKNNLNQGPERPEDSPEMKQYKKERQEAIDAAKKLELELAHKLEKHEFHAEKEKAQDFMRQTDFPEIHPEGNNSPEYRELQEMFAEIQTDHVEYPFFRRVFPNFIHVCESSRIGQSFSHDVLGLALGVGESLVSVVKLAGHMTLDTAKFIVSPRKSYRETKEIVS
jgi:hypothetical protein